MNFLAHFYLSAETEEMIVGSFLGDFHKGPVDKAPEPYREGVALHRRIDERTDTHPAWRRSRSLLAKDCGHYAPIVTDVFYDYFLASRWPHYSSEPLEAFATRVYQALDSHASTMAELPRYVAARMRDLDWLTSYQEIEGIRIALERMSGRLRHPYPLHSTVPLLETHEDELRRDFEELFADLRRMRD